MQLICFSHRNTYNRKCHLLKMWHIIEATKKNFFSKRFSPSFLLRRFLVIKLKYGFLFNFFFYDIETKNMLHFSNVLMPKIDLNCII
jgi:hypothetical protein